jgi:hypothetical protein
MADAGAESCDDAMRTQDGAFGLAGGCTAVVLAAFATAALVSPDHFFVRAVVTAAAVGVVAAALTDWRACAGVAVFAALLYMGFLVHRDGVLTGDPTAWPYTIMIGLAALLGRGERRMRRAEGPGAVETSADSRFLTRS